MSEVTNDPKFCPPAAALKSVGLTVAEIKTNDSLFGLISERLTMVDKAENQIAVACYIAYQRGFEYDALAQKTGLARSNVQIRVIEGMAILRTGESRHTTSAIRAGKLSKSKVDELTKGTKSAESKIEALEKAAVESALAGFMRSDDTELAVDAPLVTDVFVQARNAALADSVPATAHNIIAYIPTVSESFGIKRKVEKRDPDVNQGVTKPQLLEVNLKKAVADMRALALAAEEAYVPTPQDWAAFVALTEFLDVYVDLGADTMAAIDALVAY